MNLINSRHSFRFFLRRTVSMVFYLTSHHLGESVFISSSFPSIFFYYLLRLQRKLEIVTKKNRRMSGAEEMQFMKRTHNKVLGCVMSLFVFQNAEMRMLVFHGGFKYSKVLVTICGTKV